MTQLKMGSQGKDLITDFVGRIIGRCEYISGCNQLLLAPKCKPDGAKVDAEWFDEQRIVAYGSGEVLTLDNGATPGCDIAAPKI